MKQATTTTRTPADVLKELEALGTEQNRKTFRRHGVGGDQYGVSYANLKALHKKIKVDHDLAVALWESGNHDARVLATLVADPARVDARLAEAWAGQLTNYVLTDALSGLVSKSPAARAKAEKWTKSKDEWVGSTGWNLLARLAAEDRELPDGYFEEYLGVIERGIHSAKNRVRYAMNGALIGIGLRSAGLEKKALAAAARVGAVEVDHGETSCKTPDAADYIRKVKARKK